MTQANHISLFWSFSRSPGPSYKEDPGPLPCSWLVLESKTDRLQNCYNDINVDISISLKDR